MRNWLSERLRGWCTREEVPEDAPAPSEAESIEAEDLAGWLIRMARQPGRSAMSVLFVGRLPTPDDLRPRAGTFRVIWWN